MAREMKKPADLESLVYQLIDDGAQIVSLSKSWEDGRVVLKSFGYNLAEEEELRSKYNDVTRATFADETVSCWVEFDCYSPATMFESILYCEPEIYEDSVGLPENTPTDAETGLKNYYHEFVQKV